MCGYLAIIDLNNNGALNRKILEKASVSLFHRGPDEEGIYISECNNIGLMHRRLSIIGLKDGMQPIFNEDKSIAILFNGEIYNYQKLKSDLMSQGHIFRTHTDTEVIIHLYEEYGDNFPGLLDGMFSIFIWDSNKNKVLFCRDRLGKKPLFYYLDDNWLIVASEIKAITALEIEKLDLSHSMLAVEDFLIFGNSVGEETIFSRVKKNPPASLGVYDLSRQLLKIEKYWSLSKVNKYFALNDDAIIDKFKVLFENAIRKRMISDVPVGAFLSGGLDSTAVVATAKKLGYDIETFTIGFSSTEYNESYIAADTAKGLGVKNTKWILDKDVSVKDLIYIMSRFDEPFYDHSAIPTYFLSKMISKHYKVALSGDGGDESFIGYKHYDAYSNYPSFSKKLPDWIKGIIDYIKLEIWDYIYVKKFSRSSYNYINTLLKGTSSYPQKKIRRILSEYKTSDFYDVVSKIDLHCYLSEDILVKVDRMSMANSLEIRCPLLDYELVDFLAKIPSKIKLGTDNDKKRLLKLYMKREFGHIPEIKKLLNDRKKGFRFPMAALINQLEPNIYESLLKESFLDNFAFEKSTVLCLINDYFRGNNTGGKIVWLLFCLYIWWAKINNEDICL